MSEIHHVKPHRLPLAEAKKKVQQAADQLAQDYEFKSEWDGDTLHFSRQGVTGSMAVNASEVTLDVKLGLLLRAFKAKFEEQIDRKLDQVLTEQPGQKRSNV